jgi:hypothetical protein
MSAITELPVDTWTAPLDPALQRLAHAALEQGSVLWFPRLAFELGVAERQAMAVDVAGSAKNVSYDPARRQLRGSAGGEAEQRSIAAMMARYAEQTLALLNALLPGYAAQLQQARTSYRPAEIAGRQTSWRKDDTRLHVDSFPSSPTQGARILRVFSNINPQGQRRVWRLGGPFDEVARRFLPKIPAPAPGSATLLQWLHVTKSRRSAYDHYMLQLHDRMKSDPDYQRAEPQRTHEFPPGSSWMVFTDQAPHAALQGRYALEQTFHLPVAALQEPELAPLNVLQRLLGRELV